MPVNVKDVRRYIARPQHLGGAPDIDVPLPVTVDGYDMWEIQALLAMRTDKKSRERVLCLTETSCSSL